MIKEYSRSPLFHVVILAVTLFTANVAIAGQNPTPILQEAGGSNYAMYVYTGNMGDPNNRFLVCHYHLAPLISPGINTVQLQLKQMREAGQEKLALPLWHAPASADPKDPSNADPNCAQHWLVNSRGGDLLPQQQANLTSFVRDVAAAKFKELTIRFAPMGDSDPGYWSSHGYTSSQKTDRFTENWIFIEMVRAKADSAAQGTPLKITYDLNMELPWIDPNEKYFNSKDNKYQNCIMDDIPDTWADNKQVCAEIIDKHRYISLMWNNYVYKHRDDLRSFGFSANGDASLHGIRTLIRLLKPSGVLPTEYAIDLYGTLYETLRQLQTDLDGEGLSGAKVRFMETNYNDPATYKEITDAMTDFGLNISSIMQWWVRMDNIAITYDFPRFYFNYRPHNPIITGTGWGWSDNRSIWFSASGVDDGAYIITLDSNNRTLGHYTVAEGNLNMPTITYYGITSGTFRPSSKPEQDLLCIKFIPKKGWFPKERLSIAVVNPTEGIISPSVVVASPNCR